MWCYTVLHINIEGIVTFLTSGLCYVYRFLADRFVEGTCPLCGYEVSNKPEMMLLIVLMLRSIKTKILIIFSNG